MSPPISKPFSITSGIQDSVTSGVQESASNTPNMLPAMSRSGSEKKNTDGQIYGPRKGTKIRYEEKNNLTRNFENTDRLLNKIVVVVPANSRVTVNLTMSDNTTRKVVFENIKETGVVKGRLYLGQNGEIAIAQGEKQKLKHREHQDIFQTRNELGVLFENNNHNDVVVRSAQDKAGFFTADYISPKDIQSPVKGVSIETELLDPAAKQELKARKAQETDQQTSQWLHDQEQIKQQRQKDNQDLPKKGSGFIPGQWEDKDSIEYDYAEDRVEPEPQEKAGQSSKGTVPLEDETNNQNFLKNLNMDGLRAKDVTEEIDALTTAAQNNTSTTSVETAPALQSVENRPGMDKNSLI